jgi:hypothetical protein
MTSESSSRWFRFRCSRDVLKWKRILKWSVLAVFVFLLAWFEIAYWTSTNEYVVATSFWAAEKVPGVGLTREVNR